LTILLIASLLFLENFIQIGDQISKLNSWASFLNGLSRTLCYRYLTVRNYLNPRKLFFRKSFFECR